MANYWVRTTREAQLVVARYAKAEGKHKPRAATDLILAGADALGVKHACSAGTRRAGHALQTGRPAHA